MWEIREGYEGYRDRDREYGRRKGMGHTADHELKEAYECGYEEGYEDAMRELEGKSTHGRMRKY
jgi:hypothetical protein